MLEVPGFSICPAHRIRPSPRASERKMCMGGAFPAGAVRGAPHVPITPLAWSAAQPQITARKGIFSTWKNKKLHSACKGRGLTSFSCWLWKGGGQKRPIMGFTAQLSLRAALSPAFVTCELQETTQTHTGVPGATSTTAETLPGRGQGCGKIQENPPALPQK